MVEEFQNSIFSIISGDDKVLLAVSGGMDSTLMCFLCKKCNVNFAIAHCNFQLRGEESDNDALFVKDLAKELSVPYYEKVFDTKSLLKKYKGSTQMLARKLRYQWFEEVKEKEGFQYVATAHHLNDSIETVIYNLSKGTGIRGLRGILQKSETLIRPLLNFSKSDIEKQVFEMKMKFRADSSNESDDYNRNKIRHHVVPVLESINPSLSKTMGINMEYLGETEKFLDYFLQEIRNDVFEVMNDTVLIHKKGIQKYSFQKLILFELLRPFQFNADQVNDLIKIMNGISGKQLFSSTHRLINDRNYLIIDELKDSIDLIISIDKNRNNVKLPNGYLSLEFLSDVKEFSNDNSIAFFDVDKLSFPLTLRKWKNGDEFFPIGMKGQKKKVKKVFSDLKLSIIDKEKKWILESDQKICWLVGIRSDERFKVTSQTKNILKIIYYQ